MAVITVRRYKKEVKEGDRAGLIALKIYSKVSSVELRVPFNFEIIESHLFSIFRENV